MKRIPYSYIYGLKIICSAVFLIFVIFLLVGKERFDAGIQQKILLVVDSSRSMGVEDMYSSEKGYISRLEAAKMLMKEVVDDCEDRCQFALMSFAGKADLHTPFSRDFAVLKEYIDAIAIQQMVFEGSEIAEVFASVVGMDFDTMVLFSDMSEGTSVYLPGGRKNFDIFLIGLGADQASEVPGADYTLSSRNDEMGRFLKKELDGEYFAIDSIDVGDERMMEIYNASGLEMFSKGPVAPIVILLILLLFMI